MIGEKESDREISMESSRRRIPVVALLLSLCVPGLGQMYNGQFKRGIVLCLWIVLLGTIPFLTGLFFRFYGMLVCLVIFLASLLFVGLDAFIGAIKAKGITLKPYNKWYIYLVVWIVSSFLFLPSLSSLIKNNVARAYRIPSSGMEPALLVGDYLIADMIPYKSAKPKRGDIVVFEYPKDPSKYFIKRVIGLEGEKVQIIRNKVYINEQMIEDPWGHFSGNSPWAKYLPSMENFGPVVVPKDCLFVLGDNRDNSQDSRFWGFVNIKKVKGKPLYLYWAANKARLGMQVK